MDNDNKKFADVQEVNQRKITSQVQREELKVLRIRLGCVEKVKP